MVVGNIHVLFNPKRGELKIAQARVLFETVHRLRREHGASALICGDFNSTADSAIYEFMASGRLNLTKYDRRKLSGQQGKEGLCRWTRNGPSFGGPPSPYAPPPPSPPPVPPHTGRAASDAHAYVTPVRAEEPGNAAALPHSRSLPPSVFAAAVEPRSYGYRASEDGSWSANDLMVAMGAGGRIARGQDGRRPGGTTARPESVCEEAAQPSPAAALSSTSSESAAEACDGDENGCVLLGSDWAQCRACMPKCCTHVHRVLGFAGRFELIYRFLSTTAPFLRVVTGARYGTPGLPFATRCTCAAPTGRSRAPSRSIPRVTPPSSGPSTLSGSCRTGTCGPCECCCRRRLPACTAACRRRTGGRTTCRWSPTSNEPDHESEAEAQTDAQGARVASRPALLPTQPSNRTTSLA